MNVLVILNKAHKTLLTPLINRWKAKGYLVRFKYYEDKAVPDKIEIIKAATKADAVMMLVPPKRLASTLIDGPAVTVGKRRVPISLVPVVDDEMLKTFIAASLEVHDRDDVTNNTVTLLSQRLPRYLKVTDKICEELKNSKQPIETFKWTSDIVHSGDMLYGINQGAATCLYMGHGRASGWVGYYGVRAHHITKFRNKPSAAILSLCCWTAGRKDAPYSFCETLMMEGISSSVFGAVKPTLFTDNTRWAISLSAALQKGAATVGELIVNAYPTNIKAAAHYRLFGDPTAPLLADIDFIKAAQKIRTYE